MKIPSLRTSPFLLLFAFAGAPVAAQSRLSVERVDVPVRNAGILNDRTGRWTRGVDQEAALGLNVLFNNNAPSGYYNPQDPNQIQFGEGRIPSTDSEGNSDLYTIDCFQIAYCTDEFPFLGVFAAWYSGYDSCTPPIGAPEGSYTSPGLSLPGTPTIGTQACWIVTIDIPNFQLVGDHDGVFDNIPGSEELDDFGWEVELLGLTAGSTLTGLLIAGDPNNAPFGAGTDPSWGFPLGPEGTGLHELDQFYIEDTTNDSLDGCYWFGGYANNSIWGAHWHQLTGEAAGGGSGGVPCDSVADDGFEPNDTCGSPHVNPPEGIHTDRFVAANDEDWYQINVLPGQTLWVDAIHDPSVANINSQMWSACGGTLLAADTAVGDNVACVIWTNTMGSPQTVRVRVFIAGGGCNFYDMRVKRLFIDCANCTSPDPHEPNDTCGSAEFLTNVAGTTDLTVQQSDDDWYVAFVAPGQALTVASFFAHTCADLQMELYGDCGGPLLASSTTTNDFEEITWVNPSGTGGVNSVYIRVYLEPGTGVCNEYQLVAAGFSPGSFGGTYCVSTPLSTGAPSDIWANSTIISVSANNLVLSANNVPDQPGIFIAGPGAASLPFLNGVLCVAPAGLQRIKPVLMGDPVTEQVSLAIDLDTSAQTPTNGCTSVNVNANSPYHFQYWTRDPAGGGSNANFSSGIQVFFVP